MARTGPLLTETQWKKIAPLLPRPPQHRRGGRPWIENRQVFVDSADRGSLAGPAGEISASFNLLAAFAGLGGARGLVENLASVPERVERTPTVEMERVVSGRQFCSGKKG